MTRTHYHQESMQKHGEFWPRIAILVRKGGRYDLTMLGSAADR
jgi:hypothetical protein